MTDPTNRTLADWIADLDGGDADVAAGDVVAGEAVFAELERQLADLEATPPPAGATRVASRR